MNAILHSVCRIGFIAAFDFFNGLRVFTIKWNSLKHDVLSLLGYSYQLLKKTLNNWIKFFCQFRILEDTVAEGNIFTCLKLSVIQRSEKRSVLNSEVLHCIVVWRKDRSLCLLRHTVCLKGRKLKFMVMSKN